MGLHIASDITISFRKNKSHDVNNYLSKLNDRCPQEVYDNILNNKPNMFPSSTKYQKLILKNMPYMVADLKPLCSAMISAIVTVVDRFVFIMMITCYLSITIIL